MFKEFIKDGHKIKATEKAYQVIYKNQGYIPYEEITKDDADEGVEEDLVDDSDQEEKNVNLNNLKVDELRDLAKQKGIEGYSKMKKEELIAALAGE